MTSFKEPIPASDIVFVPGASCLPVCLQREKRYQAMDSVELNTYFYCKTPLLTVKSAATVRLNYI